MDAIDVTHYPLLTRLLPGEVFAELTHSLDDAALLTALEENLTSILQRVAKALVRQVSHGTSTALCEAIRGCHVYYKYFLTELVKVGCILDIAFFTS